MCIDILRLPKDAVRRKFHTGKKNGEPTVGLSFTTMPQHTGRFWSRISLQRIMWQHWSIRLVTWLPRLKLILKGRLFCGATDITKNATEELKRLSQNGFQECFKLLYGRW